MGREIRRVPEGWEHPKDRRGSYVPLLDGGYESNADEWVKNCVLWNEGKHPDQLEGKAARPKYFWEWDNGPPIREHYREEFTEPATHYQIYETVTEGTPVSPVFADLGALQEWLVAKGYSPEAAAGFAKNGWAPSMIIANNQIYQDIASSGLLRPEQQE